MTLPAVAHSGKMTGPPTRCILACLLLLLPVSLAAQHDERSVRAAFVFHLTKYVEWPNPKNELVIGFAGDGTMGETLRKVLDGKNSDGRTLRVLLSPSDEQLQQCDLLYVAYSTRQKTRDVLSRLQGKNILTLGETGDFARDGGMVGLVRDADQIQIQINLVATQSAGFKLSSRVLNLAVIVRSKDGN